MVGGVERTERPARGTGRDLRGEDHEGRDADDQKNVGEEIEHVLQALSIPDEQALQAVRLPRTNEEIQSMRKEGEEQIEEDHDRQHRREISTEPDQELTVEQHRGTQLHVQIDSIEVARSSRQEIEEQAKDKRKDQGDQQI